MTTKNQNEGTALMRLDPQSLIQSAIDKGSGIEVMERLVALAERVQANQAKQAWYDAVAQFQAECPPVVKNALGKIRTTTGSQFEYKYATLDEITRTIGPILGKYGLSFQWKQVVGKGEVTVNCRLCHELGHYEESGDVVMPVGGTDDRSAAGPSQRVGIALSYAKRYALLGIAGIAPEDDPDGEIDGEERSGTSAHAEPQRKSAPAPDTQEAVMVFEGIIDSIGKTTGETNGKPWTLYLLKSGEHAFSTLDETIADVARSLVKHKAKVGWMVVQRGEKKYRQIQWVEPLESTPDGDVRK